MQTLHFPALNALTQALAWTVINSLWQGILVAVVAALILWLMRFRSAKARYVVAYSSLMLLLTVVALTFFTVFSTENSRYTEGALAGQKKGGDVVWQREVLCQNKITKDIIKTVILKLKADGCLDNSVESDEITKEIRTGIETFQTKYKLPVGNLNLETIAYLGI
jgi:hypothetical protein